MYCVPVVNNAVHAQFFQVLDCTRIALVISPDKDHLSFFLDHLNLTWIPLNVFSHNIDTKDFQHGDKVAAFGDGPGPWIHVVIIFRIDTLGQ